MKINKKRKKSTRILAFYNNTKIKLRFVIGETASVMVYIVNL
jgi:hypothetical protein